MSYKINYKTSIKSYSKTHQGDHPPDVFFNNQITNEIADESEKWFNTDEAAKYLSISPNALRILVHRARIKYFKLGSRLKFRLCDLLCVLQPQEA